jgi:hypothetical protein
MTTTWVALLAPVITAVLGGIGILTRDLYNRRSEKGRRTYAMDDATRQVTFAAEWWNAKQALGSASDDQVSRAIVESWLEEAISRVAEALHPPTRPEPERSVARRILLAYPFDSRPARAVKLAYYLLLALTVSIATTPLTMALDHVNPVDAISVSIAGTITYGFLAFAVRAWAVSIDNRAAKKRISTQPSLPTSRPVAPQQGWYPDPSGVKG